MQICIEINYNYYQYKLIDKWLTQSVQNSSNSLDAFKPLFKMSFFSLILIASLKRRIFQFLWRSMILMFLWTKFIRDILGSCTSSAIVSENSDGANLAILNICETPLHSLRWVLTTLSLSLLKCSTFLLNKVLWFFPNVISIAPKTYKFLHNKWLI